jgi:hypothetical protein
VIESELKQKESDYLIGKQLKQGHASKRTITTNFHQEHPKDALLQDF